MRPEAFLVAPVTDFLKAIAPHCTDSSLVEMFEHCDEPSYTFDVLHKHLLYDTPETAAMVSTVNLVLFH